MVYFALKYLHLIGATILLGTGAGIAFFMLMAHRTGEAVQIAAVARIVVVADFLFTATAVVAQPITGIALAWYVGYSLTDGWIVLSILLYIVTGCFWLPVVWMQLRMRDLAEAAASKGLTSTGLSPPVLGLVRVRLSRVCGRPRHPVADDHAAGLPLLPIGNVSAHFRRERLRGDCHSSVWPPSPSHWLD